MGGGDGVSLPVHGGYLHAGIPPRRSTGDGIVSRASPRRASSMKRISVLLADDHLIVREGFRALLAAHPELHIVGEADDGFQAVALALTLRPDVVLMDIAMPRLDGLEATRQIRTSLPTTKVLILTSHSDDAYIDGASAAGAAGFLPKQASAEEVGHAISVANQGRPFFTSLLAQHPHSRPRSGPGLPRVPAHPEPRITAREAVVLKLIAEGNSNKIIAEALNISAKTVEKHREHIMKKLDVHEVAGLTRYAIAKGITGLDLPPSERPLQ
jgi:DNA-binding NarL/FixJ family response regulator